MHARSLQLCGTSILYRNLGPTAISKHEWSPPMTLFGRTLIIDHVFDTGGRYGLEAYVVQTVDLF